MGNNRRSEEDEPSTSAETRPRSGPSDGKYIGAPTMRRLRMH
jgi:hypothetical protein